MTKFYTGVGSRETPVPILQLMHNVAYKLRNEDWILRSGGADGADTAFEQGAYTAVCHGNVVWYEGSAEIYLPWRGFGDSDSSLYHESLPPSSVKKAVDIAKSIHPNWAACSSAARKLHARNVYQVLGKDCGTPSKFLVCWTEFGLRKGGTRTAIVLAERYEVPVYNLGDLKIEAMIRELLNNPDLGTLLAGPRGLL
jgi:hypothetical protein